METRCPLCNAPINLARSESDLLNTISNVECPNCGLVPLHMETTIRYGNTEDLETISHFRLVRELGQGSFGTVWLADDLNLGRQVALKLADEQAQETNTLIHEARAAAELNHANIISVHEVGDEDGRVYIASEYIDGLNLRDLLSTGRPNLKKSVEITRAVARALQHAHDHGVVHRDIKPSNIMIDGEGKPFVADFGLAKRLSGEVSISTEGTILGTALYMSPEQAAGDAANTDGRSDQYALGVMLFEMLTGHVPFRGNVHAVLHQKTHDDAPSPRTLNAKLPKDLETICVKCLEREPEKRYRSTGELADELERYQNGVPIHARPVSSLEKAWRWCLRNKAVAGLVSLLLLSMTLGLIFVSFYWRKSVANEELANQRMYRSEMNLLSQYFGKGDINSVKRTLERFESDPRLAKLRDFAWHHHRHAVSPYLQVTNQGDPVVDVAVFADGRFYAACGNNQQTRVWDTQTGELVRELTIPSQRFQSIAASPSNSQLATGSTDGMIRIWNPLQDDRPARQLQHGTPVRLVRYSRDGQLLLSAGVRGLVRIWNPSTGEPISDFPTGMSGNVDVRFSPDGKSVAVATKDGRIRIRDPRTGDVQIVVNPIAAEGLNPLMESMVWSDDAETIFTGSYDGMLRAWSVADGERIFEYYTSLAVMGDMELLDDRLLAVASISGSLTIFDTTTRRPVRRMWTHNLTSGILDRSADGRVLVVGSGGGSVKLLDTAELSQSDTFWDRRAHNDPEKPKTQETRPARLPGNPVRGVAFLPRGKRLLSAVADSGVSVWSIDESRQKEFSSVVEDERVTLMAADFQGQLVAVATLKSDTDSDDYESAESTIRIWDIESGELVETFALGKPRVGLMRFSPSGESLAFADQNGKVTIYRTADWTSAAWEETPHDGGINDLTFSPDDATMFVACKDGNVIRLSTVTGEAIGESWNVPGIPLSLSICGKGQLIAIGTETGKIQFHHIADGVIRRTIQAHASRVNVIAAFPGGNVIVSGGRDRALNLWDTETGDLISALYGHRRQITSLAISADGATIASGGLLGEVRVWRSR